MCTTDLLYICIVKFTFEDITTPITSHHPLFMMTTLKLYPFKQISSIQYNMFNYSCIVF